MCVHLYGFVLIYIELCGFVFIYIDFECFHVVVVRFGIVFIGIICVCNILNLFCLSLRILWDPWAQDLGPRSDGRSFLLIQDPVIQRTRRPEINTSKASI